MKENNFKAVRVSAGDIRQTLSEIGVEGHEASVILATIHKRNADLTKLTQFLFNLFDDPIEAMSASLTLTGNFAMTMADIDAHTDEGFIVKASDLAQDLIEEQGMEPMEALALLAMTGSLIASAMEEDMPQIGNIIEESTKKAKKEKAKEEVGKALDSLFDGKLSEEELAKKLASIISKSK